MSIDSDGDVIVRVGNPISSPNSSGRLATVNLAGWQSVRVQRSCEQFPSVFEVIATERYPGDDVVVPAKPGQPCQVLISRSTHEEVLITGYVDAVVPALDAERHSMRIIGRGKCEDLVDCPPTWPSGQFNNMSALSIAQKLGEAHGITASQIGGDQRPIPKLVFMWTETCYDLIERVARSAGMLVYEDENGNVVFSRKGAATSATGIAEGKNVIRASVSYSMAERYSRYRVRRNTFATFTDSGADPEGDIIITVPDDGVPRYRPLFIIAETPQGLGVDYAIQRGQWEASRRFGRSSQIQVTIDSWRDGSGILWAPNTIVDVDLPSLKVDRTTTWIISTVVFRRDERGTSTDLLIMPAGAFDVLPVPLTPLLNTN